ncbi:MAG: translation elongation factor 4 [Verrucomicrobia bacterium]|nr:translation elongation factor 4 [Verrucomicrobiota bacterium]
MSATNTRNFCIIAHVDHGKTTLSDRLLEHTNTVAMRSMTAQHLDSMDLERERGITIKSHPVTMTYRAKDGKDYKLNLMDTPGHVDFSYEVSRSLAACEGAVLLIDAGQGVEAQTVANAHLAFGQELKVIPVINKIDLPSANLELCTRQLEDILTIPAEEAILASGKSGIGIVDILEAVVARVPPPRWTDYPQTRILVFDSLYDAYRGCIAYVRVFSGSIKAHDMMMLMSTGQKAEVKEVGIFTPKMEKCAVLNAGDVGYIVSSIKTPADVKTGDTITLAARPATDMLPGYKEVRPMVFCGLYPLESDDYEKLKAGLARLQLNDAAFVYSSESSLALGFGFRCGFLGLLHMEIIQERVRREHADTLDMNRVMLRCILPLNEILVDFNDRLKSITHGYGSMDYELAEYMPSDLVKMDIMINGDPVDAFACIVHRMKAEGKGRHLCEKLAEIIPPQMFKVAIQAAIGGKIIARDNVREMRKDVTAKCYGGDISRKRTLLDKQKEGKKKMKQIGKVSIPPDAFIKVLQNG